MKFDASFGFFSNEIETSTKVRSFHFFSTSTRWSCFLLHLMSFVFDFIYFRLLNLLAILLHSVTKLLYKIHLWHDNFFLCFWLLCIAVYPLGNLFSILTLLATRFIRLFSCSYIDRKETPFLCSKCLPFTILLLSKLRNLLEMCLMLLKIVD